MYKGKPVIGLSSSYKETELGGKIVLLRNYFDFICAFGGIPLLIPATAGDEELTYLFSQCDGLLLTGGNDITPSLFGEELYNDTVVLAPERDETEWKLCQMAQGKHIPMLGICRGMQFMNVYFGGSLYQDLPAQYATDVAHRMEMPIHRTCHDCILEENSPIYTAVGEKIIQVNSHHHQAVKALAPGFRVAARCSDGVVEAIWNANEPFCWGVQWHPEKIWDINEPSCRIMEAFIRACK